MNGKLLTAAIALAALIGITGHWLVNGTKAEQPSSVGFDVAFNHVGISVPNLDESIKWYHDVLGFELLRKMHQNENPEMDFALIQKQGVRIELFQVVGGKPLPDYRSDPTADLYVHGVKHVAFTVTDIHAAVADLKAKGVRISKELTENPRTAFVFFDDNAGNAIELIQPKQ